MAADSTITIVGTDRDGRAVRDADSRRGYRCKHHVSIFDDSSMTANATLAADNKTLSVKTITPDDAFTFRVDESFDFNRHYCSTYS